MQSYRFGVIYVEILRQDRLWYRNRIKEQDEQVLLILDKYKRYRNLQQLQIQLRKYITKIKQKQRKEQLNHFKQNFCLGVCTCQVNHNPYSQKKKSIANSKPSSRVHQLFKSFNDNHQTLHITNHFIQHKISHNNSQTTIQNEFNNFQIQQNKNILFKDITNNYHQDLQIKFTILNTRKTNLRHNKKKSNRQSQQRKPLEIEFLQCSKVIQKLKKLNVDQSTENQKTLRQNYQKSDTLKQNFNTNLKQNTFVKLNPIEQTNYIMKQNDSNIFTPPQLLQQCRKIIQKSAQSKKGWDTIKKNDINNSYEVRRYSCPQQISKQNANNTFYTDNPFKMIELSYRIKNNLQQSRKNEITVIVDSYQYAEDIFDLIIKYCPSHTITTELLREIIQTKFSECKKTKDHLYQIYQRVKLQKSTVRVNEIGARLQKIYKPKNNRIRNLHSLIDVNERGYFSYVDYRIFVSQMLDSEKQNLQKMTILAESVFRILDMYLQQKIYYWNIYFKKNNDYVHQFLECLHQFQFQMIP